MMLYIVRHGETGWNRISRVQGHTDVPLNDHGRRLAEETAEGMRDIPLDLGLTSPLSRAKETAEIILRGRNIPLLEDDRLMEIGFGSYEGLIHGGEDRDPRSPLFDLFFTDTYRYVPPEGAETLEQLYERTGDFLREMCQRKDLDGKNILVSTHGAAMTAMLNRIKNRMYTGNFWPGSVPPNCSVTMVEVKEGRMEIVKEGEIYYKEKVQNRKSV